MTVHERAQYFTTSSLDRTIPDESELTANVRIEPGRRYGFFTDTSLCIGCKACEVACKEWNVLPSANRTLSGQSYDNTLQLSASTWRHVAFIEQLSPDGKRPTEMPPFQSHWLMMSDVCKHCSNAPCLEACPTGAIFRTEFDTVVVQQDICNGCGYCVPVSVRSGRSERSRRKGSQMHIVLRSAERRSRAGLLQSLSHQFHPVR